MLLHLAVESIGETTPPATVLDGARYIVGVSAVDAWFGHDNQLAMWIGNPGYWIFRDAYFAYNKSDDTIYIFSAGWLQYATQPSKPGEINTASNLGSGIGLYKQKMGVDLQFKSIVAGENITLDNLTNTNEIVISSAGASSIEIESHSSSLTSDVQLATLNTWYDGPSVTLGPGTWLINGTITVARSATNNFWGRISDGTNHYASTQTVSITSTTWVS